MTLPALTPARGSQCAKILAALKTGPKTAAEIHQLCGFSRLNSRIAELRKRGHEITCERGSGTGPAAYLYTLVLPHGAGAPLPSSAPARPPLETWWERNEGSLRA